MITFGIADRNEDYSCALAKDGHVFYAADVAPEQAFQESRTDIKDVASFCYFEKPLLRLERAVETHLAHAPRSFRTFKKDMPYLLRETAFKKKRILKTLRTIDPSIKSEKLLFSDHILSLCAVAFYPSTFERSAILCLDDMGEWAGTAIAIGDGNRIRIEREIPYPHSLGFLLDAFSSYLCVDRKEIGEMAKKGQATYARMMVRNMIDLKQDGSFCLNQSYFGYASGKDFTTPALHALLGGGPRENNEPLGQKHYNIAASIMAIITQAVSSMIREIAHEYRGIHNLCITGKLLEEDMVRERILRDHTFDHVDMRVQDGNKTLAIGAALAAFYTHHDKPRDIMFLRDLPTAITK